MYLCFPVHPFLGVRMIENNPLRQYFRRPAMYLKLPSGGKNYPLGSLELPENGEIPIYPMTAIDEITTKTPDALFNGVAVVEIIKSCAPAIKDPWVLPVTDLDAILVAIRAASSNDGLEVNTICPKCDESNDYKVNLSGVLANIKAGDYDTTLNLGALKVKFKPLSYKEVNETSILQTELQRQIINNMNITDEEVRLQESTKVFNKLNDLTFELVSKCIEAIEAPTGIVTEKEYINDFLKNCDRNQFEDIKTKSMKLREESETKPLKIKCPSCSHDYEQAFTLNISDFFD
jgi:phage FluMu protein Com